MCFVVKRFFDGSYGPGGQFYVAAKAAASTGLWNPKMSRGRCIVGRIALREASSLRRR